MIDNPRYDLALLNDLLTLPDRNNGFTKKKTKKNDLLRVKQYSFSSIYISDLGSIWIVLSK